MPQPKWYHKSLSELCMDSIVDNMEKWTALRSLVHVSTPFYLLPSHCLEYIIQCLNEGGRLNEEMFDLLLNPHLKVLDLSENAFVSTENDDDIETNLRIVRLASVRCSQLTTLKFFSFNKLPSPTQVEETFTPILQLFEHLQILDLSSTIYGASCMLYLGSTCKPKIRELLVDCCPGVTDLVMQVFCNSQSSLHKLSVLSTKVTHAGIRFAIEHLPELKELSSSTDISQVLFRICKETRESKKCSLTKFSMRTVIQTLRYIVPYKKGNVSLMVEMCPSLVDLFIDVNGGKGFTNEELLGFRELKLIKSLVIDIFFMPSNFIRGGVIPLLQVHGRTLEKLTLSMPITSEEFYLIIECCPNIRRLLLSIESRRNLETPELVVDGVYSSLRYSKEVIPFRMLEEIILLSSSPFAISRKLLLLLLFSPSLTLISILNCKTLDDQIIEEACTRNSFKYLTKLELFGCSNVSQKGIDFFMNETNPLSEIALLDCGNVNPENMKTMAQEKHWNQVNINVC
ncbi:uncharacterized protein LOC124205914 isoform X1 [Daphnia pulex]|uniref:uncharacterized protein LOC124205914 isoform X1 n=1 Tax=Daphnia pulex TaxID=6669 RepID=UPI001EDF0DFD|nr:uncharacterized protein LOC124205914 isoform X1 [Daphnia pulex]XP_046459442.1 uncharacterized protein LOC124205914 isoform X1 [Daphnia pulex]XP_046459443.1 uncharacterized protein LOC124205914 isoform X1 [Daphnia pulex]